MSQEWLIQRERSNLFWLRLGVWGALTLGRRFLCFASYFITSYFYLFTRYGRQASRLYLSVALGRPAKRSDVFKHFRTFGTTILDRAYLVSGKHQCLDINVYNLDVVKKYVDKQQGCILLGSHLGSFEVLRAVAMTESSSNVPLKVLMNMEMTKTINGLSKYLNKNIHDSVIEVNGPETYIEVDQYIKKGYLIGVLGDRVYPNERIQQCDFFGKPANFPMNPYILAQIVKAPIVLCYGLYKGGNRYDVHFELLTDKIIGRGEQREKHLQCLVKKYVQRLEYYTKLEPYNWFNFYNYWVGDDT